MGQSRPRYGAADYFRAPRRDIGSDPDYRFSLANERTFLAWIRTALAFDAGGLAVIHLLPPLAIAGARETIGVGLVLLGSVVAVASYRRWLRNEEAMRTGDPLPLSRFPGFLAVAVSAVSIGAVLLLIISSGF